jgi:hypothetical protein
VIYQKHFEDGVFNSRRLVMKYIIILFVTITGTNPCLSQARQQWAARFNYQSNFTDGGSSVAYDNQGNVYVTGYSHNATPNYYNTVKYNSSGVQQWVRSYYSAHGDSHFFDIAVDAQGSVYISGGAHSDFVTIKYSSNGDTLWTKIFRGQPNDSADNSTDMFLDNAGNVYIKGYSRISGII